MMRQDDYTEWKCKVANPAGGSWKGELCGECWGRGWEVGEFPKKAVLVAL